MTERPAPRHWLSLVALAAILCISLAWWALALWPLPEAAPPALLRARVICFGTADNGLPSGVGWMMLIGQPIMMTLALVVITGSTTIREALAFVATNRAGRVSLRTVVGVCGVAVLAAGARVAYALGVGAPLPPPRVATVVPPTYPRLDRPAPALTLTDQRGERVSLSTLVRPAIVTFAYAHCQTICPLTVQEVLRARDSLRDLDPAVLVVSLDPWRDTPARLPAIAEQWHLPAETYLLSGAVPDVEAVLDAWNVARARDPKTGAVTHANLVYLVDRAGRIAYATTGDASAIEQLARRM